MDWSDRAGYDRQRYQAWRSELLEILGGKCVDCGSDENLEFDHVDPSTKLFAITSNRGRPRVELLAELDKCQLLCKTCHKVKSDAESAKPHGGGVSGKRNCKCDPCRLKKNAYAREYKARRRREAKLAA